MFKAQTSVKLSAAGVIAGLLLAGCGGGSYDYQSPSPGPDQTQSTAPSTPAPATPAETPSDTRSETPSESPSGEPGSGLNVETSVATYQAQGDVWPTAALEGSLMLLDSGCLKVREAQGENAFIPVFPISHDLDTWRASPTGM